MAVLISAIKPEVKVYDVGNCHIVEDQVPPGMVVIDEYHPHSCPWDYYALCHQQEYSKVLSAAGIEHVLLRKLMTIIHPIGSGPRGMVRFGDNMTPGDYYIAVEKCNENAAIKAIVEHRQRIADWLDHNGPMPEACKR